MKKTLPPKYYLTHFDEFLRYIENSSAHLLDADEKQYLERLHQLDEDSLCLYVRVLNRKSPVVGIDTLRYEEISDIPAAIDVLKLNGLISTVKDEYFAAFLEQLTKPDLVALCQAVMARASLTEGQLTAVMPMPVKSAVKADWLAYAQQQLTFEMTERQPALQNYIVHAKAGTFDYLLFLYFGHLKGQLNQFSMRDLGIIKTYKRSTKSQINENAHFRELSHAKLAYKYSLLNAEAKRYSESQTIQLAESILKFDPLAFEPPAGRVATEKYHQLLYKLALKLLDFAQKPQYLQEAEKFTAQAVLLLESSEHGKAREKLIRLLYQQGETQRCREMLEELMDNANSESLVLFATDFYQRKFDKKRTSIMTDMLRESGDAVMLDEAWLGNVEKGMQAYYERQGVLAVFTENKLWKALFALFFWHELYEHEKSRHSNEFQRFPVLLSNQRFYEVFEAEIEGRLASVKDKKMLMQFLTRQAVQHYGKSNGIFRWSSRLLPVLKQFISHAPLPSVLSMLRFIAQDYEHLSDGFPDLMIIDEAAGSLRFEEIKSPGDMLRQNQVITIQKLQKAGFDVAVRRTEWRADPMQPYVVVDIETTGGLRDLHRITEVGMVKVINGEIVDTWQSLINPQRLIPRSITRLTGIDNAMVADAPVFAEVADDIAAFSDNAIFVAHNVNFDLGFIKAEYERLDRGYQRAKLCTVQLARKAFPGQSSYSLAKLCYALDIELTNHHRALSDAMAAAEILIKVKAQQADKA